MEILRKSCPNTPSLSIPNLGSTLEPIIGRFFDKIQKSVIIHIFCTHLHWCNVEYSTPNILVGSGLTPKPSLEPFRVIKIDDFSLLWHCHTTNRSWDRNRFWHSWIFTHFGQDLLCTLYLTVESFRRALWEAQFCENDFQKSFFSPCGMNGYEHDLGREKTNLDVFYTILNFFFASDAYFKKSPQNSPKSGFPYSFSCVIQVSFQSGR